MKQSRNKTAYLFFVTVVIFVMAVFSTVSYAWLVNYVHGDFGFNAGELDSLKLEIARISVTTATPDTPYNEANRTAYKTCANNKIETKEDGTHLDAKLDNMSFGAIDNVAQLKPENVVYFRLTVPKSVGNTVKVNFHYTDNNFIELYKNTVDADGKPQSADSAVVASLLDLEDPTTVAGKLVEDELKTLNSYLLFDAVVSNTDCAPDKIAETFEIQKTDTTTEGKFNDANYKKFVTDAVYTGNADTYTLTLQNTGYDSVAEGGNYYVYVKVVPNLALFAHSIEYITDIMPCYMFFKVSATFEALYTEPAPTPAPTPAA